MDGPDTVYGASESRVVGALEERSMRGGYAHAWEPDHGMAKAPVHGTLAAH
jgi:hypothetical protein